MAAERKRGCGFRKVGGLYLCADGPGDPCHRLPIELSVCPTCHAGIKQTRGWTWVRPDLLGDECDFLITARQNALHCLSCPACNPPLLGDKAGLIWIGEKFYNTPSDFTREAITMGVSRRITAIPKGFKVGEHYVLVAHPKATTKLICGDVESPLKHIDECYKEKPGIFHVFKPNRIEKILADNADSKEIAEWEKKGCKVVLLPHDDPDHQGSVYDDNGENTQVLDLDEVKGVL